MKKNTIKLFQNQKIRAAWNSDLQEWFFSVVDVVQVLTESADGRKYWNKLKRRLNEESSLTDVATTKQLLRLIQSIPSKKAEPFKVFSESGL